MNGMWMGGMGALWPLFILFWILLIAGVVVVIGWLLRGKADSPLEILRRRYARGEIDRETYTRMRQELREDDR
jgi:putative membrane protein